MATLAQRITDLAAAVRDKFNAIAPKLVPAGGTAGQVLAKTSAADHAVAWVAPGGGGGGSQEVFVQQTRPVTAGPWIWLETDALGNPVDMTFNDGVA